MRGPKHRKALKYFGKPAGTPGSSTRPRCIGKGNQFEKKKYGTV